MWIKVLTQLEKLGVLIFRLEEIMASMSQSSRLISELWGIILVNFHYVIPVLKIKVMTAMHEQFLPTRVIQMGKYKRPAADCSYSDMAINEDLANWFSFIALFKIFLDVIFFIIGPAYNFWVTERLIERRDARHQEQERIRRVQAHELPDWDAVRLPEIRHHQ
jgi:hypothetical protein